MNTKLYYEYCSRVLNGEIIAGETIKSGKTRRAA